MPNYDVNCEQRPPPEEAEPLPPQKPNETWLAAQRLASASVRESNTRVAQVDGREAAHCRTVVAKSTFTDLARTLIRKGVDNFEQFIHAQYRYSVPRGETLSMAPNPVTFKHDLAFDRYLEYHGRTECRLRQQLESLHLEFECCAGDAANAFPAYTNRQLWNYVLMNKMLELPPLFRYCIAASEGLTEPMEEFYNSAVEQLLTDPMSYCAHWSEMIPASLIVEAENILGIKL